VNEKDQLDVPREPAGWYISPPEMYISHIPPTSRHLSRSSIAIRSKQIMAACARRCGEVAGAGGIQGKISDTYIARIRVLFSRQLNMQGMFRGLVFRHRKPQRRQINTSQQCLTLTEGNRHKCKVEGID
jgi:hypothetical protein